MAAAMMRFMVGHERAPRRNAAEGRTVTIGKGCRQGAPETPTMWNIVLDGTLVALCKITKLE